MCTIVYTHQQCSNTMVSPTACCFPSLDSGVTNALPVRYISAGAILLFDAHFKIVHLLCKDARYGGVALFWKNLSSRVSSPPLVLQHAFLVSRVINEVTTCCTQSLSCLGVNAEFVVVGG